MARKKHAQAHPAQHACLYEALQRITRSESVPPLDAFLDLGRELHEARLDFFISEAFSDRTDPASMAKNLLYTSCRHHAIPGEQARLGDAAHVRNLLGQIEARAGFWPYVRDEVIKFSRLVAEELRKRVQLRPAQPTQSRRGRRPANDLLLDFDENARRERPSMTDKEVLDAFKKQHPRHPIFESDDPRGALRAARSRRKKKPPDA
jgi:hypothetical protein